MALSNHNLTILALYGVALVKLLQKRAERVLTNSNYDMQMRVYL